MWGLSFWHLLVFISFRNASPSEGLNLLLKAVDELENEMLEG